MNDASSSNEHRNLSSQRKLVETTYTKRVKSYLQKYSAFKTDYELSQINILLKKKRSLYLLQYKERLIEIDMLDLLQKFYSLNKSEKELKSLYDNYKETFQLFPNYIALGSQGKIIYRNIYCKQQILNMNYESALIDDCKISFENVISSNEIENEEDRFDPYNCLRISSISSNDIRDIREIKPVDNTKAQLQRNESIDDITKFISELEKIELKAIETRTKQKYNEIKNNRVNNTGKSFRKKSTKRLKCYSPDQNSSDITDEEEDKIKHQINKKDIKIHCFASLNKFITVKKNRDDNVINFKSVGRKITKDIFNGVYQNRYHSQRNSIEKDMLLNKINYKKTQSNLPIINKLKKKKNNQSTKDVRVFNTKGLLVSYPLYFSPNINNSTASIISNQYLHSKLLSTKSTQRQSKVKHYDNKVIKFQTNSLCLSKDNLSLNVKE